MSVGNVSVWQVVYNYHNYNSHRGEPFKFKGEFQLRKKSKIPQLIKT